MGRRGRLRAALAALVSVTATAAVIAPPAPAQLRAGAASADLTPPVGTPMFAYTARSRIANPANLPTVLQLVADPGAGLYAKTFVASEGIHTRVRARALVLERDGRLFAMAQADLGGLPYAMTQEVLRRVRGSGITGERLLLSATHTHSSTGPIWPLDNLGYALLGGDLLDPRVFDLTAQGIAEALLRAKGRLAPAQLGVGTTELRGASRNRASRAHDRNEDLPADPAERARGRIDPTVTVVRVDDREGRPIAAWSNFAVHPTSFDADNLLFSGDNAGTAARAVEAGMAAEGGGSPAADGAPVNVWTNGAQGDVSPDGDPGPADVAEGDTAKVDLAGRRTAEGILRAWRAAADRRTATPALEARRTFLAFDGTPAGGSPVGPVPALGAGGIFLGDGTCAPVDGLAGPGQGEKLPFLAAPGLAPSTVPLSLWRVGGLAVAGLPSEVTKQMGQRIRAGLQAAAGARVDRVALAGLTNGYISYTATPEEYGACGYEGSFTLFGKQQGRRLLDGARALVEPVLTGAPAPAGAPEPLPTGLATPLRLPAPTTPQAGRVVREPVQEARRGERVTFAWRGGAPALDAPRGATLVRLERRVGDSWRTEATDDGPQDTTRLVRGTWTETLQLDACQPLGTYRLRATGRADRGRGVAPYTATSRPFVVRALALDADPVQVSPRGVVTVRARYPDPGAGALLAQERFVTTGRARLRVDPRGRARARTVVARPKAAKGTLEVRVGRRARVRLLGVRDGCGNATGGQR
ncbi:neutral/alkaline non-lysosomal ceramidase N-terminal domain-containing protein [Conexibacter sp. SYSU D00693]|uniref:neutral/alkaline non-lysosomal ceramidase N-terminal domain-containing protein n=1 Tax=Conexibacter sp. SYSU D00693 TaxID=2812560 RepID=UPI00196B20DD|nr:neutral/alkaline non-lysosomal ceramidase N-terminal domain-containing protein [Conexibacter sp. SYSU D00693]